MKMKKYEVSDMKEALRMIKEDLGPDAVILSTRKIMKNNNFGLFAKPLLEVTATVSYSPLKSKTPLKQATKYKVQEDIPIVDIDDYNEDYSTYHPPFIPKTNIQNIVEKSEGSSPLYGYNYWNKNTYSVNNIPKSKLNTDKRHNVYESYQPEYVELASTNRNIYNYRTNISDDTEQNTDYSSNRYKEKKVENNIDQLKMLISTLGLDKLSTVVKDITDIKKQLLDMKSNVSDNMVIDLKPKLKEYYTTLTKNNVDDVIAYRFLKNVEKHINHNQSNIQIKNTISEMLSQLILIEPDYYSILEKKVITVVGPTGVGKTTTVAKIAAELSLKYKKKVCLITMDNFRIGAKEQLKTYAEIVGIPLYVASTPEELKNIIKDTKENYDFVLLDSMGRSQFDTKQIETINSFINVLNDTTVLLVLSLASNHKELSDTLERYGSLSPNYLVVTKLDETRYFGPLLNLTVKKKLPLLLVTTGQNVPDDMEMPSGKKIAKKLLQEIPTLWSEK